MDLAGGRRQVLAGLAQRNKAGLPAGKAGGTYVCLMDMVEKNSTRSSFEIDVRTR
jgi:hypothetical protein